jgi:predicted DNA-binding WGR domain protein
MIPNKMLGRYEYKDEKSDKFWTIEKVGPEYKATWGRIGSAGQGPKIYTEGEAYDKIQEKISKGYVHTGVGSSKDLLDMVKGAAEDRKAEAKKPRINFMDELRKVK